MVRETFNTPNTVKACVTFFKYVPPPGTNGEIKEKMKERGEDPKNPFLQICALMDLGSGINGYAKTAHGGFFGVVLDEVMGTAANLQAGISLSLSFLPPFPSPSLSLPTLLHPTSTAIFEFA